MSEETNKTIEEKIPEGVVKLTADDGYVYTDPERQIVGKTIYVIEELKDTFIQVSEEEGKTIQEEIDQRHKELYQDIRKRTNNE